MTHAHKITFYKIVCECKPPTLYSCSSIPSHPSHLPTIKSVHTHLCNSQSMLMCGVTLSNVCCTSYLLFLFVYKIIQPNQNTNTNTQKNRCTIAGRKSRAQSSPCPSYQSWWASACKPVRRRVVDCGSYGRSCTGHDRNRFVWKCIQREDPVRGTCYVIKPLPHRYLVDLN